MTAEIFDRRTIIALLAAVAAAHPTTLSAGLPPDSRALIYDLIAGFRHPADACRLGEVYLKHRAEEANLAYLLDTLAKDLDLSPAAGPLGVEQARKRLKERAMAEFSSGAFMRLGGIHLTQSEFRICAVIAMLARGAKK